MEFNTNFISLLFSAAKKGRKKCRRYSNFLNIKFFLNPETRYAQTAGFLNYNKFDILNGNSLRRKEENKKNHLII